jgi:hypothetical protein
MKISGTQRRGDGLQELRLIVPDARSEIVRRRMVLQINRLNRDFERRALDWIETVSEFDGKARGN